MSDLVDLLFLDTSRRIVRLHLSDLVEAGVGTEDQLAVAFLAWLQHNRSDSSEEAALRFRLNLLARMATMSRPEIKTIGEAS